MTNIILILKLLLYLHRNIIQPGGQINEKANKVKGLWHTKKNAARIFSEFVEFSCLDCYICQFELLQELVSILSFFW